MHLDTNQQLQLTVTDFLGESVAVLGIKGSGKSNTSAVIAEELSKASVPMAVVDIAGEYWGLKEKFNFIVVGKSPNVDLEASPEQGASIAEFSLRNGMSVILDISGFRKEQRFQFLEGFFEKLWEVAGELRKPYSILLEESHNYIPQQGDTPLTDVLVTIATEGRKRGLGIIMAGQRSARIDKDVLTQAGILILHGVRHPSDVGVYQDIIPKERKWTKAMAVSLETGQAIVVTNRNVDVVTFRAQETYHAGYTPGMEQIEPPTLQAIDKETIQQLKKLMTKTVEMPKEAAEVVALRKQVKALENERDEYHDRTLQLEEQVARQQIIIDTLSVIRVEVPPVTVQVAQSPDGEINVQTINTERIVAMERRQEQNVTFRPGAASQARDRDYAASADQRDLLRRKQAQNRQRGLFDRLTYDVSMEPAPSRAALLFLMDHPDKLWAMEDLEARLGYASGSIKLKPLIDRELIRRTGSRGYYRYRAGVVDALSILCPSHEVDDLVAEFMQAIVPKMLQAKAGA